MEDHLKPRRPRSEEQAEIEESPSWAQTERKDPPLHVLVQERKEDEEAAFKCRHESETAWEREESEHILSAEGEMEIDIPVRRERELLKTFPGEISVKRQGEATRVPPANGSPSLPPNR